MFKRQDLQMFGLDCYRNSRLAVDEDDLKWVANEKKIVITKTVL